MEVYKLLKIIRKRAKFIYRIQYDIDIIHLEEKDSLFVSERCNLKFTPKWTNGVLVGFELV